MSYQWEQVLEGESLGAKVEILVSYDFGRVTMKELRASTSDGRAISLNTPAGPYDSRNALVDAVLADVTRWFEAN